MTTHNTSLIIERESSTPCHTPVNIEPHPLLVHSDGGPGVDVAPPGVPPDVTAQADTDHAGEPGGEGDDRHGVHLVPQPDHN